MQKKTAPGTDMGPAVSFGCLVNRIPVPVLWSLNFRIVVKESSVMSRPDVLKTLHWITPPAVALCMTLLCLSPPDENSNQSFMSDVYQSKMDNSSSTSSSQQVTPPHTSGLPTEDSQPPMLGQETVEGMCVAPQHLSLGSV